IIPLKDMGELSRKELMTERGKFIEVKNSRIYIEDSGLDSGKEAIILVHGFGGSTYCWRYTVPVLKENGYRTINIDLKGFGLSTKGFEGDYSHIRQAEIISEIMNKLDIKKAHFIAHSMGSNVVFHLANLYPSKIDKLICIGASITYDKSYSVIETLFPFAPVRRLARHSLRYITDEEQYRNILESAYHRKNIVDEELFKEYYNRTIVGDWDLALMKISYDSIKNIYTEPLSDFIYPTLLLWGEYDNWVNIEEGEKLNNNLPNSEFIKVPLAGHLPMEEKPEETNASIIEFLKR
ncbi:MAG: alpha/beta fold hydrolase, partial [Spirochaetota bacterium]